MGRLDEYGDVLTVEDLHQVLGIGINQAYRFIKEGHIRSVKIGKRVLVPKQAVEQFLKGA